MIDVKHLLKTVSIWVSVVYTICYAGVALYPASRSLFMRYALHADVAFSSGFFGFGYFISGLVLWNITAIAGAWLFAFVFNKTR